jgi:hypothetical protein
VAQRLIEVDVDPFASSGASMVNAHSDELDTDSPTTVSGLHQGIEDERVSTAVPDDVDPSDKVTGNTSANPAKAVLLHLTPPVVGGFWAGESRAVQALNLR